MRVQLVACHTAPCQVLIRVIPSHLVAISDGYVDGQHMSRGQHVDRGMSEPREPRLRRTRQEDTEHELSQVLPRAAHFHLEVLRGDGAQHVADGSTHRVEHCRWGVLTEFCDDLRIHLLDEVQKRPPSLCALCG